MDIDLIPAPSKSSRHSFDPWFVASIASLLSVKDLLRRPPIVEKPSGVVSDSILRRKSRPVFAGMRGCRRE